MLLYVANCIFHAVYSIYMSHNAFVRHFIVLCAIEASYVLYKASAAHISLIYVVHVIFITYLEIPAFPVRYSGLL